MAVDLRPNPLYRAAVAVSGRAGAEPGPGRDLPESDGQGVHGTISLDESLRGCPDGLLAFDAGDGWRRQPGAGRRGQSRHFSSPDGCAGPFQAPTVAPASRRARLTFSWRQRWCRKPGVHFRRRGEQTRHRPLARSRPSWQPGMPTTSGMGRDAGPRSGPTRCECLSSCWYWEHWLSLGWLIHSVTKTTGQKSDRVAEVTPSKNPRLPEARSTRTRVPSQPPARPLTTPVPPPTRSGRPTSPNEQVTKRLVPPRSRFGQVPPKSVDRYPKSPGAAPKTVLVPEKVTQPEPAVLDNFHVRAVSCLQRDDGMICTLLITDLFGDRVIKTKNGGGASDSIC